MELERALDTPAYVLNLRHGVWVESIDCDRVLLRRLSFVFLWRLVTRIKRLPLSRSDTEAIHIREPP